MKKNFSVIFLALIFTQISFSQDYPKIRYITEQYPPANFVSGDSLDGLSIQLLKEIWKFNKIPEQKIEVLPWSRAYQIVQDSANFVLFSMSRTPIRESLFKWVGPIFSTRHLLVGVEGISPDIKTIEEAKKFIIGVVGSDISEIALREVGFKDSQLEITHSIEMNVNKLVHKRVPFICVSEEYLEQFQKDPKYADYILKSYFVVNEVFNYFAFNKSTPDSTLEWFQNSLIQINSQHKRWLKYFKMWL